jgi:hypothetical protein
MSETAPGLPGSSGIVVVVFKDGAVSLVVLKRIGISRHRCTLFEGIPAPYLKAIT